MEMCRSITDKKAADLVALIVITRWIEIILKIKKVGKLILTTVTSFADNVISGRNATGSGELMANG
jgi:hypothetical protein